MAALMILMDHPCENCGSHDARLADDDGCFERYLEAGGIESLYDPVEGCNHFVCVECDTRFDTA